jgi:predicted aspartyl protease
MYAMGHTFAKVSLYNPNDLSRVLDLNLIVDTGSTYTWVKKTKLNNLGIKPIGKRVFKTIEGRLIEREIGEAIIEYENEKITTIVVFAEEEDVEVLGVYALEGLGLEIDPITRKLKKSQTILAL